MRRLALMLVIGLLPLGAGAEAPPTDSGLQPLMTSNDSRGWEAVGRIDIAGRAFCTGTLIATDLVLTVTEILRAQRTGDEFRGDHSRAVVAGGSIAFTRRGKIRVCHRTPEES